MRGKLIQTLSVALALAGLALGAASPASARRRTPPPPTTTTTTRPTAALVPAAGALFGAYSNPDITNWWTKTEVLNRETLIGRRYAIDAHVAWYGAYGKGPGSGMLSELQWDLPYGRIPLLSFDGPTRPFPGYAAIANGSVDTYILQPTIIGKAAKVSGFTVLASVLAFGALFRLIGAIIAVPIAAALQIVVEELTAGRRARIAGADAAEPTQ